MKNLNLYLLTFTLFFIAQTAFSQATNFAIQFDGQNDYVDLGNFSGNGMRSVEFWFKMTNDFTDQEVERQTFIYRNDNQQLEEWGVYLGKSSLSAEAGRLVFVREVTGSFYQVVSNSNYWQAGKWYHVAGTIHPTQGMSLYIDGVLQNSTHSSTAASVINNHLTCLGRWGDLNIRFFQGRMDEVRIWNRSLSGQEINENLCDTINPANQSGLIAYWRMNEGTGVVAKDISGNYYDATLQGPVYVEELPCIKTANEGALASGDFTVYPNPAAGRVNIDLGRDPVGELSIHLFNGTGAEVKRMEFVHNRNVSLDLQDLRAGIYFYRLTENGVGAQNGTLIIE
ncbi:MAG: T9SS type A sorting domain-containing protein [Bacteroidia bacterium]|nr:T9SS type A sorting domain-containing protein [Bacteroidia bacterium]